MIEKCHIARIFETGQELEVYVTIAGIMVRDKETKEKIISFYFDDEGDNSPEEFAKAFAHKNGGGIIVPWKAQRWMVEKEDLGCDLDPDYYEGIIDDENLESTQLNRRDEGLPVNLYDYKPSYSETFEAYLKYVLYQVEADELYISLLKLEEHQKQKEKEAKENG